MTGRDTRRAGAGAAAAARRDGRRRRAAATGGTTTMVMDPPPPAAGGDAAPEKPGRPGMGLLPIAIGVGLLAAAVVLSRTRSRSDGDLDWSNYCVGLGAHRRAAAGRAGRVGGRQRPGPRGAGDLARLDRRPRRRRHARHRSRGIDGSEDWLPYLVGGVIFLLSAVGYAAVRRGAFAVTAIVGLGLAYIQLADDVLVDIGDEDDQAIIAAATITVFVLAVTAVGWLLRTRAISGVVAGVIGVVGLNAVLLVLVVSQVFDAFFGTADVDFGRFDGGAERRRSLRTTTTTSTSSSRSPRPHPGVGARSLAQRQPRVHRPADRDAGNPRPVRDVRARGRAPDLVGRRLRRGGRRALALVGLKADASVKKRQH